MDRKWALAIGAVVLIVVLALVAVQCAGDDDEDDPATTTQETTTSLEETTTSTTAAATTTTAAEEETTTTTEAAGEAAVLLASDGLTVDDADLAFGASGPDAIAAVSDVLGAPSDEGDQADCPAGPATYAAWGDVGLSLTMQDDVFVGWSARPNATLRTADDIGIGSPVADLLAAHPGTTFTTTSLGEEFDADGLEGIVSDSSDSGEVTDMWAGTTCIFR